MPFPLRQLLAIVLAFGLVGGAGAAMAEEAGARTALRSGVQLREQGELALATARLRQAEAQAGSETARLQARAELGAALLQARQFAAADAALASAYQGLQGVARARVALDLGNLRALQGGSQDAARLYEEAQRQAGGDPQVVIPARLNLARTATPQARLASLSALAGELARLPDSQAKARWQINLGEQARGLGDAGLALAHGQFDAAQRWALADPPAPAAADRTRLAVEALDALAQLYEDRGRPADAQRLNAQALRLASGLPAAQAGDLPIALQWRQARLAQSLGRAGVALGAWRRAVRQIETLRQDIPINDDSGASSFSTVLEPVYLGLADALLAVAPADAAPQRSGPLREAVDTLELVRQAELQDYLGDRCDVDAVKGGTATVIPAGTAVLYPVLLADRLELLVETGTGISRHRSPMAPATLREATTLFAQQLRAGRPEFLAPARRLYDAVLRPVQARLAAESVRTLVVVPDASLRLVSFAALHDGQRFAVEHYAIAMATGMSMTNTAASGVRSRGVLLAGLSDPGPVVDKLSNSAVSRILGTAQRGGAARGLAPTRALGASQPVDTASVDELLREATERTRVLREALALPGVAQEITAIEGIVPARRLLNEDFTLQGFSRAAETGQYGVLHVASHGVFGGSADASYILAYDDLLTLDGLQSLLRSDRFRRQPIELLTLSACETAEGDARSPLGLSGAAIKARAKAVMGSLWPVADEATVELMQRFYAGLLNERLSKAEALQQAQLVLLRAPGTAHPFYWAPFVVIGNWH